MSVEGNFGDFERTYHESHFEWKLKNFTIIVRDEDIGICESPAFPFENVSWYIRLCLYDANRPDCMALSLRAIKHRNCSVEYNLGLKTKDNNVEQVMTGTLKENILCTDHCYMKRLEVLQRKQELAPRDVLTITCTLRRGTILLSNPKPTKLIRLETLSENFKGLFNKKESSDVTMHVQGEEYRVHKTVLVARSPFFAEMFENDNSVTNVDVCSCDQESIDMFLQYLYSGEFEEPSPTKAVQLYEASDEYKMNELKQHCSDYLMRNLTVENLCKVAITADQYDDTKLFEKVQLFFTNNLRNVLESPDWSDLLNNHSQLAQKLLLAMSTNVTPNAVI